VALRVCTMAERPELEVPAANMDTSWPEFMRWDPIGSVYFGELEPWAEFVLFAVDDAEPDVPIAKGFSVPFTMPVDDRRAELPDGGWDYVILWALQDQRAKRTPTTVSAIEISVRPDWQGKGLSSQMVAAMQANAARLGFTDLVAPVRPNRKSDEPLTPMTEYAHRVRADGLPYDDWLRVHARLGAQVEKVASRAMTITGTLDEWRRWTGLAFDRTGPVIVPGALVTVHCDVEHDHAVYVEPNVWMRHRLS